MKTILKYLLLLITIPSAVLAVSTDGGGLGANSLTTTPSYDLMNNQLRNQQGTVIINYRDLIDAQLINGKIVPLKEIIFLKGVKAIKNKIHFSPSAQIKDLNLHSKGILDISELATKQQ